MRGNGVKMSRNILYKYLLSTVLIVILFPIPANAESTIIINGLPMKKVMSDIGGTESVNLTKDEGFNYRLLITKKGDKYIWASREDKELIFSHKGEFYNFVEPNGTGYIRVAKTGDNILYEEHLTLGFKNITYWGMAQEFNVE